MTKVAFCCICSIADFTSLFRFEYLLKLCRVLLKSLLPLGEVIILVPRILTDFVTEHRASHQPLGVADAKPADDRALDEAASSRDGGSGLGGCADWERAGRR